MNLWYISRQSALKRGEGDTRSKRRQSEVDKITTLVAKRVWQRQQSSFGCPALVRIRRYWTRVLWWSHVGSYKTLLNAWWRRVIKAVRWLGNWRWEYSQLAYGCWTHRLEIGLNRYREHCNWVWGGAQPVQLLYIGYDGESLSWGANVSTAEFKKRASWRVIDVERGWELCWTYSFYFIVEFNLSLLVLFILG